MWQLATKLPEKSCHFSLFRKVESQKNSHTLPLILPMLQRGQYGKQILANVQQQNDFPFNICFAKTTRFLIENDFVAICII